MVSSMACIVSMSLQGPSHIRAFHLLSGVSDLGLSPLDSHYSLRLPSRMEMWSQGSCMDESTPQDASLIPVEAVSEGRWNCSLERLAIALSKQNHQGSKYPYHCGFKVVFTSSQCKTLSVCNALALPWVHSDSMM